MAEGDHKRPKWLDRIAGDTRQTVVSLVVTAVILTAGGWITGAASSDVPLWTVGVLLVVAGAALLTTILTYERRQERLKGELAGVERGVSGRVEAAEEEARTRIREADERAQQATGKLDETRQLLAQATSGQVPLTPEAQGLLRSVRTLIGDLEASDGTVATIAQREAFVSIVDDFEREFGPQISLLQKASALPHLEANQDGYVPQTHIRDLRTMLGQLDAFAMNQGQISAQS